MAETLAALPTHGARVLPSVEIDGYNAESTDDDGFVGDRARKGAFREIVEGWRKLLRKAGRDPLGNESSEDVSTKRLDQLLADGAPDEAGLVIAAVEEFSQELALVIRRFMRLKAWRDTERIVVGGGMRGSRVGELIVGRTGLILKSEKIKVDLTPIRHDPDEAGLVGAAHLVPAWILKGHDAIIAIDIGGSNIRAGVVELNLKRAGDLSKAKVGRLELWRHADEGNLKREDAVSFLIDMLEELIAKSKKDDIGLAPFIGIGCPGEIEDDGSVAKGAQNLPGNWESAKFNLPAKLREAIPAIDGHETAIIMHNDAVVQGLSEVPFMRDVERWGVLTIGTGLGNARFTNRESLED